MNIYISSDNRLQKSTTTNADFVVNLTDTIIRGSKVRLQFAAIPNTYCQVTARNNQFSFNSGAVTGVVAVGNYTLTELLTALQTAINATALSGFTVTYNDVSNTVTVACATSFVIDLIDNSIFLQLGFESSVPSTTSAVSNNNPFLFFKRSVFITIDELSTRWATSDLNRSPFTFVVPNTGGKSDTVVYKSNDGWNQCASVSSDTHRLSIKVTDELGYPLEYLSPWEMVLTVE